MRRNIFICLLLAGVTLAVYWPVGHLDFINYDDGGKDGYVVENANVESGITLESIGWAFTTTRAGNWHPITWLSLMLDCQLFGLKPAGHHWVNLGFHIVNTLLLFVVLREMTQTVWRSALVAALFAWHPLHIQSVAWVSERKDVLSGFFMLLTLWAYTRYAHKRSKVEGRRSGENAAVQALAARFWTLDYGLVLVFFVIGLMSKPMLVTVPLIMLLLDFWPLGRVTSGRWPVASDKNSVSQLPGAPKRSEGGSTLNHLLFEKLPFVALSLGSGIVTVWAQGTSVVPLDYVPWDSRIENSMVSCAVYLGKLLWPENLAIFYPFTYTQTGRWGAFGCGLLLIFLSVFFIRKACSQSYLFVGWFWFLVMLLPVIGLVQISVQSIADRYTYLPSIGLFIVVAWGIAEVASISHLWRTAVIFGTAGVLSACLLETRHQLGYWQNSVTLFSRALEIAGENPMGDYFLGNAWLAAGNLDEAAKNYRVVLRWAPNSEDIHYRLGYIFRLQKKWSKSEVQFDEVLRVNPNNSFACKFLGDALSAQEKFADAETEYSFASQLEPGDPVIQQALEKTRYLEALHLKPDSPAVLNNLAWMLATSANADIRDGAQAVQLAERACGLTDYKKTIYVGTLAAAYAEAGRFDEAMATAQKACALASKSGEQELLKKNQELLDLYRKHQKYHEIPGASQSKQSAPNQ
jgi:tetratricopeptide (TPR) repeat protein